MLVAAHSRLHWRGEATRDDVDAVMPFIWRKMNFLQSILFGGQTGDDDAKAGENARRKLLKYIVSKRGLNRFSVADLRSRTGITTTTPATMDADLRALYGNPDAEGYFLAPAEIA